MSMSQQFDRPRQVYINRDAAGVVRELLHLDKPAQVGGGTPALAASSYLESFGDLLGIAPAQLSKMGLPPSATPTGDGVEYRRLGEKRQFDTVTASFSQTDLGLPVWQAGVSVTMRMDPPRVLTAQSTLHPDLKVEPPTADEVKRLQKIGAAELARHLGLGEDRGRGQAADPSKLRIEGRRLIIYRYEAAKRVLAPPPPDQAPRGEPKQAFTSTPTTLPLPPVPDTIREGAHYVAEEIDFELPVGGFRTLHWVAIVEAKTLAVLYLRAFTGDLSGLVFASDPVTSNGGPSPSATSAALNPDRTSVTLLGLNAPVNGTQSLAGNFVALQEEETPTIAAPTEPANTDFDFDARTDNFAAVNAYYHCDAFFRLVQSLGFDIPTYFGGTTFPSPVDHRGRSGTTDGVEVNAHCVGTAGGAGISYTSFMLADTGDTANPIGIACDFRVVLHELGGHGVLYNHVHSANFLFSHSAGDSVAVITNDPGSEAPDRFLSFPWVGDVVSRRHDRDVASGWGWSGQIALNPFGATDGGGYNNEQILSTTLFRLYRSLGGDAADVNTKRFAARYAVYLILRAIGSLTPATTPADASGFATALIAADAGDWTSESQAGGAYGKVIRWAFEKQGMYQPAGTATPNNSPGAPPAIDVYIDDDRGGEYQYQPDFWTNQNIWNRTAPDGGTAHQDPIVNVPNYAYVKVKNRGSQAATGLIVQGYHANPSIGLSYPNDWQLMTTPALAGPDVPPNSASEVTVGPFEWTPTHIGHECMFMIASCPGDSSNAGKIAAGDSIPEWRIVPNDNNIGQRNVAPVAGGGGLVGLLGEFTRRPFRLKNPLLTRARMLVEATFPSFLARRGWGMHFLNPGGGSLSLDAGQSVEMIMQITPGDDFTPEEVAASPDPFIHVRGYADGTLVGGLSFVLDPNRKHPPRPTPGAGRQDACTGLAKDLLGYLHLGKEKVRDVRLRKINVDVEFEEHC